MEPANNYIVLNIREFLNDDDQRLGEEKLKQLLSEFSCPAIKISLIKVIIILCYSVENWYIIGTWQVDG